MAIEVLTKPRIFLGPYDCSGDLSSAALSHSREQKDSTTFGMAGKARKAGLYDISAEGHGYWNGAAPGDLVIGQVGLVNVPMTLAPANNNGADGEMAYVFPAAVASYELGDQLGNLLPFTVKAQAAGDRLVRSTIMHAVCDAAGVAVTRTSSGTGTVRQLGAVTATQRLYIAVHVIAASGSLTITVKSSAVVGMGSPTTQYTSAAFTTIGSDWTSVAGAITDTYYRVDWTISGGGPSFQFLVAIGII